MSAVIEPKDVNSTFNTTILHALGARPVPAEPLPHNRRERRAMRKRKVRVTIPPAAPRLGAAPRVSATRRGSGTSRTRPPAGGSSGAVLAPPTFNPIASTTVFGPPTDISAGWDGTLWAIDASGAPHLYDPLADQWNAHGDGVDAVAAVRNTLYLFRSGQSAGQSSGGQVIQVDLTNNKAGEPAAIGATWPALPDSFKIGVTGAANLDGTLYLFKGGWYLPVNAPDQRAKLAALQAWPTTANWTDGVIDAVVSNGNGIGQDGTVSAILTRGSEYIVVDFKNRKVIVGPQRIETGSGWNGSLPDGWAAGGWDGAVYLEQKGKNVIYVYRGPQVASFPEFGDTRVQPKYIASIYASWPHIWNPMLNHAPSGRMGNLWCATTARSIVQHDGQNWNTIAGRSPSVAIGQDSSVYVVCDDNQTIDTLVAGKGWVATATAPVQLTKVTVGDDDHVFALGNDSSVHRLVRSSGVYSYTSVDLGANVPKPTHMSANADGTLWHCNNGYAKTFRLISESTNPSDTITLSGEVTSVHKVASTGFGAAHCLVTQNGKPQLYRYDSPYLFKTAGDRAMLGNGSFGALGDETGGTIAQGLGNLYFVQLIKYVGPGLSLEVRFIALDAHTGNQVASYTPPSRIVQYTGFVFDPVNELIYVGTAPLAGQPQDVPGQLLALDARTLDVKWTFPTGLGIDAVPTLSGTQLCFGDRTNTLYMIDTRAALAAAKQGQPSTSEWTWVVPTRTAETHRIASPVIADGKVYAVAWDLDTDEIGSTAEGYYHYLAICDAATGLNGSTRIGDFIPRDDNKPLGWQFIVSAPVLGKVRATDQSEPDAIYVNDGFSVYVHSLDPSRTPIYTTFALPDGQIATGFAYDDGSRVTSSGLPSGGLDPDNIRLWFGDSLGNLWSLDHGVRPTDHTPQSIASNTRIVTTPVLYKDPQGGMTVLFGVLDKGGALQPGLHGYAPENGNIASVPTGVTGITALTAGVTNGLVCAGGVFQVGDSPKQVFGIRVDQLPQALRGFVIESQMMQDPDEHAPGGDLTDPNNPIPPSRARYQTHVTVVYNDPARPGATSPSPNEPVKIWADVPTTIAVDGVSYVIGPGDSQYAAVVTGVDGSFVITSGYIKQDGSDTPDVYASALRVWAGFMDPYERIVINPDHEFHGRVATAHANVNDDDPDKANLVSATSYAGRNGAKPTPLFTTDEQATGQPKNCASAISQMKSGLDFGGTSNSVKTLFNRLMLHAGGSKTARRTIRHERRSLNAKAQSPQKYMAYADLTGSGYFPANIPAPRPTSIAKPTGLLFQKPERQKPATFKATDHQTAQHEIDYTLPPPTPNPPWKQSSLSKQRADGVLVVPRAENIFADFWNWLKREFEELTVEITHVFVSIADEVMVGIRMLWHGVETVFKAIVKVIDDVASAIGSFFKMLFKFIEDVVAALSVLFHFGHIIATQKFLLSDIQAQVPGIKTAIAQSVKPAVDGFFRTVEHDIANAFTQLRADLNGQHINGLQGSGATAHTAFKVAPGSAGPNSKGSSHAVHCGWAIQKAKTGLPNATGDTSSGSSNLFVSAIEAFITRITGDGDLQSAFSQLQADFNKLFHVHSVTELITTGLDVLLDILETLVLGLVAVGGAFMAALLDIVEKTIDIFMGLLNAELNIPVLSWLYQKLFDQPLTVLNAITLIAAIPVTMIYRVSQGSYPFAKLATQSTQPGGALDIGTNTILRGTFRALLALIIGIGRAIADTLETSKVFDPAKAPFLGKFLFGAILLYGIVAFTGLVGGGASTLAWVSWGIGLVMAITGATALFDFSKAVKDILKVVMPIIRMVLGIGRLIVFCFAFAESQNKNDNTKTTFARNLFLCLPPIVNPLKLLPGQAGVVGGFVDAGVDMCSGLAVCAMDIALIFITAEPPSPFAAYG